jgi:hypothetical protein
MNYETTHEEGRIMIINLYREKPDDVSMIGELIIDARHFCWTIEDIPRQIKIPGKTAISAGKYEITITWSNRFKRRMPLLLNVPNFSGIRIHWGDTSKDTEGCIIVGYTRTADFIGKSRAAFNDLFRLLDKVLKKDKVFIEIGNKV